jgi:O-antigen/teichoic acid export membrane protein
VNRPHLAGLLASAREKLRHRVARDTAITLAGLTAPLIAGFVSIPMLIAGLGEERFGMLAIIWLVLGYFSIFDFGLGRAVAHATSNLRGTDPDADTSEIFWTGIPIMFVFGILGGGLIALLVDPIVRSVLNISAALTQEGEAAMMAVVFGLPLVTTAVGLRGFLEGHLRFRAVAGVRSVLGILVFVSPLFVLPFTNDLGAIVSVLVLTKVLGVVLYGWLCRPELAGSKGVQAFSRDVARRLIGFGGWLTVSNIISPMMVYMDRFVIGSLVSVTAVSYYVTPFEVVSKLLIVASAAATVLFPLMTRHIAEGRGTVHRDVIRSSLLLSGLLLPAVLFFVIFARPFLAWWINEEFASQSAFVMQVLAIGMLVNSAAMVPFASIHSANRPDVTAKIHILELPIYAVAIYLFTREMGIAGTALAWLTRVAIDTILMHVAAARVLRFRPVAQP